MRRTLVILASLLIFISCQCPEVRIDGRVGSLESNEIVEEMYSHHVVVRERSTHRKGCAGVVVGLNQLNTYVLTAAHCTFDTGPLLGVFISNKFSGPRHYGRVIARGWQDDIALVKTRVLGNVSPARMAKEVPKVGDETWVIGCPGGKNRVVSKGIVSEEKSPNLGGGRGFLMDADVTLGNSGGGVYNSQGKLIGILIQTRGQNQFSLAVHLDAIREILRDNSLL